VREIMERLDNEPAYTTIATVLGNLCRKQLVGAEKRGRATYYGAFADRDEQAALVMLHALDQSTDRRASLGHLVDGLDAEDLAMLSALLSEDGATPPGDHGQPITTKARNVIVHGDTAGSLERALATAATLRAADPRLAISVVINGGAVADAIGDERLAVPHRVDIVVCAIALQVRGASPENVRPGARTVASGAAEIVRAQLEGSAYVRL
ncbi:MAG: BlaI/MecI/CopY family transcriptional regulator, partial [Microcella sp.]|nr:BlaI/MecI/CopY family transcriptional regulator [Microcella sp.]